MNAVLEKPHIAPFITAEEFFLLPLKHGELIDGKVIEMQPPGAMHGEQANDLGSVLRNFVRRQNLGRVFVETGFRLKPDMVRSPDVSFVETARLPDGRAPRGFIDGAPNLAVEILSPGNTWSEIERKVNEYLEAGAGAVWIVDSDEQTLTVRTVDLAPRLWRAHETLEGGAVLPGFSWDLKELFEND